MTEVTLGYAEQFLQDRVSELRNQVKFGDAWVFVGAFTVLNILAQLRGGADTSLPARYSKLEDHVIFDSLFKLTNFFSLNRNIAITHVNSLHLKKKGGRVNLAAEPFLNDISIAITTLFSDAKTDPLLASKMYVSLNENGILSANPEDVE